MVENVKALLDAHKRLKHEVYLDLENSTQVPNEVVDAMLPYFSRIGYGNPTLTHKPGWEALDTIMESSLKIASFLGCKNPEDVNFMPGETEANNLAIAGMAHSLREKTRSIVISEIEPISVIQVAELLQKTSFKVTKIPVDHEGFLNLDRLSEVVDHETALVSLSAVNHEIGTIQPIREAVEIVEDRNAETVFHTDASDAFGRVPFDVRALNVDLATVSSYKILGLAG
jgi:cysteine desulfurase